MECRTETLQMCASGDVFMQTEKNVFVRNRQYTSVYQTTCQNIDAYVRQLEKRNEHMSQVLNRSYD